MKHEEIGEIIDTSEAIKEIKDRALLKTDGSSNVNEILKIAEKNEKNGMEIIVWLLHGRHAYTNEATGAIKSILLSLISAGLKEKNLDKRCLYDAAACTKGWQGKMDVRDQSYYEHELRANVLTEVLDRLKTEYPLEILGPLLYANRIKQGQSAGIIDSIVTEESLAHSIEKYEKHELNQKIKEILEQGIEREVDRRIRKHVFKWLEQILNPIIRDKNADFIYIIKPLMELIAFDAIYDYGCEYYKIDHVQRRLGEKFLKKIMGETFGMADSETLKEVSDIIAKSLSKKHARKYAKKVLYKIINESEQTPDCFVTALERILKDESSDEECIREVNKLLTAIKERRKTAETINQNPERRRNDAERDKKYCGPVWNGKRPRNGKPNTGNKPKQRY